MGLQDKENEESLNILFELVMNTPKKFVGKNKDLTKAQTDALTFDLDKIAFMNSKTNKDAQKHLRAFKRFFKILTTNLVDVFPDKKEHLTSLVIAILNLTLSK